MSERTSRRRFAAGVGAVALGALAGCAAIGDRAETEESRTYPIADVEELRVENGAGDATVRAADRSDVRVRTTKRAGDEDGFDDVGLEEERASGTLALSVERDGDGGLFGPPPSMDLDVAVPPELRVSRVRTDAGDLEVMGTDGAVTVETDAGDAVLDDVDGAVSAATDTGDVAVRGGADVPDVETNTGDVRVEAGAVASDARIETDTGDVRAALASSLDVRVDVETDTGDVTVRALGLSDLSDGDGLEGTLGEGTHELAIRTNAGDVTLARLE